MDNNQILKRDGNSTMSTTIAQFEEIQKVAMYISESDTFTSGYELKDKDGKVLYDEVTGRKKINVADIAISLLAGKELGLDIAGSIILGKKLNHATYLAALKGRELGIDIATAIEKIAVIPTKNGNVSYTMVDIISAKLNKAGIEYLPFIKNYAPYYTYKDLKQNELDLDTILDKEDNLKEEYSAITINATTSANDLNLALDKIEKAGKIAVIKERNGYYSKAEFVRTYPNGKVVKLIQRFSTIDAQRAGLLPVYNAKGEIIQEGKSNWMSNTPQMINNRVISIAGRIIGADLINGLYTYDEVADAGLINNNKPNENQTIDVNFTETSI